MRGRCKWHSPNVYVFMCRHIRIKSICKCTRCCVFPQFGGYLRSLLIEQSSEFHENMTFITTCLCFLYKYLHKLFHKRKKVNVYSLMYEYQCQTLNNFKYSSSYVLNYKSWFFYMVRSESFFSSKILRPSFV